MLTSKNRSLLRKLSHDLPLSLIVGKDGLGEGVSKSLAEALKAHELIKVKCLPSGEKSALTVGEELSKSTQSDLVDVVGHVIILYKRNPEHPVIVL